MGCEAHLVIVCGVWCVWGVVCVVSEQMALVLWPDVLVVVALASVLWRRHDVHH